MFTALTFKKKKERKKNPTHSNKFWYSCQNKKKIKKKQIDSN